MRGVAFLCIITGHYNLALFCLIVSVCTKP